MEKELQMNSNSICRLNLSSALSHILCKLGIVISRSFIGQRSKLDLTDIQ